jgi:hypothetical protein
MVRALIDWLLLSLILGVIFAPFAGFNDSSAPIAPSDQSRHRDID